MLSESLEVLGVGRQDISDSELKLIIKKALSNSISSEYLDSKIVARLLIRFSYCSFDLENKES